MGFILWGQWLTEFHVSQQFIHFVSWPKQWANRQTIPGTPARWAKHLLAHSGWVLLTDWLHKEVSVYSAFLWRLSLWSLAAEHPARIWVLHEGVKISLPETRFAEPAVRKLFLHPGCASNHKCVLTMLKYTRRFKMVFFLWMLSMRILSWTLPQFFHHSFYITTVSLSPL